jgi:NAD(P) transhydrogenase
VLAALTHTRLLYSSPKYKDAAAAATAGTKPVSFTPPPADPAAKAQEEVKAIPYSELTIGVPLEVRSGEKRVAITPQNAALLLKKGFKAVLVEHGAGFQAQFPAHDYEAAGATLVNASRVW